MPAAEAAHVTAAHATHVAAAAHVPATTAVAAATAMATTTAAVRETTVGLARVTPKPSIVPDCSRADSWPTSFARRLLTRTTIPLPIYSTQYYHLSCKYRANLRACNLWPARRSPPDSSYQHRSTV